MILQVTSKQRMELMQADSANCQRRAKEVLQTDKRDSTSKMASESKNCADPDSSDSICSVDSSEERELKPCCAGKPRRKQNFMGGETDSTNQAVQSYSYVAHDKARFKSQASEPLNIKSFS